MSVAANGSDPCRNACPRAQMAQIGTDGCSERVPEFSQVNNPFRVLGTDSTDVFRLTSRVENRAVSPGRAALTVLCGAHIELSVESVPDPLLANASGGASRRSEGLPGPAGRSLSHVAERMLLDQQLNMEIQG